MIQRKRKPEVWSWIGYAILALYVIALVYPLLNLLRHSVYSPETGFSFRNFQKFFSTKYYTVTLLNSLKVTVATTAVTLLIGAPLAYFFSFYRIRGQKVLNILIILSSMSAPFIGAYSWILLLGRNGIVTNFIKGFIPSFSVDIYGFSGILLVLSLQLYPLVFLYVSGALKNIDNSLMEAAQNLCCTGLNRFFKVVMPLVAPTLLASGLLVFMRALADFGTPMLIGEGYRTFPVLIYTEFMSEVGGDEGFAAAISVMAVVITAVFFLTQKFASNKLSFTMSAMNSVTQKNLSGVRAVLVHIFAYIVVGLSIVPQCFVIYTSFLKTKGLIFIDGYWLGSYETAFSKLGSSIQNTFIIAGTALVVIILAAVLIAYLTVRRKNAVSNSIDLISMIAYIIPGSVLGIAMLMCFNRPPLAISGGYLIMVLALVVRRLPYTIRSSTAILQQIPVTIEEASISLGSSKMKTFFFITIPMMANGIISGAILSWVTMITELSTSIILYTGRTKTLTVSIYTEVIRGNYGVAAALSTILTVLTVLSLLIFMRISKTKNVTM
ncbi:ABC transporter permease [Breznakiella homolactica]|uniref:Iron ABC transporter permease n=1 Tax=Breznakiella homolactica TaxID=2798577 RepID=A0A7T7XN86_9SPIR|nr:iron ABC transporter permease [Breznakiella homolactica]QQO09451.1 iron ABC transporter permease [Breznakiella homolactica]